MKPILIIGAVPEEIYPLCSAFKFAAEIKIGGRQAFRGKIADKKITAVVTGPGLVNVTQALTAAIEKSDPAIVIQTGCGGAYDTSELGIGDLGVAFEEIDFHLGLEPFPKKTSTPGQISYTDRKLPDPLPFPVLSKGGFDFTNRYPLDKHLTRWAFDLLSRTLNSMRIGAGPFVTVSTITAIESTAQSICRYFKPCIESMEGSGAAHVCLFYELPFLEIRGVSNHVGKRNRNQWDLPIAFETSAKAVKLIVESLEGESFMCR